MKHKLSGWLICLLLAFSMVFFAACGENELPGEEPGEEPGGEVGGDSPSEGTDAEGDLGVLTFNDVYLMATNAGFEGTLEELIELFKGETGASGADGVGVKGASVNAEGHLVFTLSDGTAVDCGKLPEGSVGAPGTDGVGVKGVSIDDDGHLIITLTNGETLDAGELPSGGGETGAQGPAGNPGEDGVGISNVEIKDGKLLVTLTSGTVVDAGELPKGETGAAGATGATGPQGPEGVSVSDVRIEDGKLILVLSDGNEISCVMPSAEKEDETVTVTLTFNSDGGTEYKPITGNKGDSVADLPVPEKDGYVFCGWYCIDATGSANSGAFTNTSILSRDMTLTAVWEAVSEEPDDGEAIDPIEPDKPSEPIYQEPSEIVDVNTGYSISNDYVFASDTNTVSVRFRFPLNITSAYMDWCGMGEQIDANNIGYDYESKMGEITFIFDSTRVSAGSAYKSPVYLTDIDGNAYYFVFAFSVAPQTDSPIVGITASTDAIPGNTVTFTTDETSGVIYLYSNNGISSTYITLNEKILRFSEEITIGGYTVWAFPIDPSSYGEGRYTLSVEMGDDTATTYTASYTVVVEAAVLPVEPVTPEYLGVSINGVDFITDGFVVEENQPFTLYVRFSSLISYIEFLGYREESYLQSNCYYDAEGCYIIMFEVSEGFPCVEGGVACTLLYKVNADDEVYSRIDATVDVTAASGDAATQNTVSFVNPYFGTVAAELVYEGESTSIALPNFAPSDETALQFAFNGWLYDGSLYQPGESIVVTGSVTVTASITGVILNSPFEESAKIIPVKYGESYAFGEAAAVEGYTFVGYFVSAAADNSQIGALLTEYTAYDSIVRVLAMYTDNASTSDSADGGQFLMMESKTIDVSYGASVYAYIYGLDGTMCTMTASLRGGASNIELNISYQALNDLITARIEFPEGAAYTAGTFTLQIYGLYHSDFTFTIPVEIVLGATEDTDTDTETGTTEGNVYVYYRRDTGSSAADDLCNAAIGDVITLPDYNPTTEWEAALFFNGWLLNDILYKPGDTITLSEEVLPEITEGVYHMNIIASTSGVVYLNGITQEKTVSAYAYGKEVTLENSAWDGYTFLGFFDGESAANVTGVTYTMGHVPVEVVSLWADDSYKVTGAIDNFALSAMIFQSDAIEQGKSSYLYFYIVGENLSACEVTALLEQTSADVNLEFIGNIAMLGILVDGVNNELTLGTSTLTITAVLGESTVSYEIPVTVQEQTATEEAPVEDTVKYCGVLVDEDNLTPAGELVLDFAVTKEFAVAFTGMVDSVLLMDIKTERVYYESSSCEQLGDYYVVMIDLVGLSADVLDENNQIIFALTYYVNDVCYTVNVTATLYNVSSATDTETSM